jgi:PAS domain S-box-containing protein
MDDAIKILLLEDNAGDVLLLRETLRTVSEFEYELQDAPTLEDGQRLFAGSPFDIVLLDLSLPDSRGMDTVSGARQFAPELPIVVLTNLDDEGQGIEAIRMGVQDYLVKGQVDGRMLARTIRYAIEHKRASVELQKARDELEQRVRERTAELEHTLVALQEEFDERILASQAGEENRDVLLKVGELIPYGLWISDAAGGLKYVSKSFLEMTGLTMEQCRRSDWAQCLVLEDRERLRQEWSDCVASGAFWDRQLSIQAKDGTVRVVLCRGVPIHDRTGKIVSYAGMNLDVTDARQLEPHARPAGKDDAA